MFRVFKLFAAALALVAVAGCASDFVPVGEPQRPVDVTKLPSMRVVAIDVVVPRSLRVSEENSYLPDADIVWRGDPYGDRYAQVEAILREAITRGVQTMQGNMPVVVHVELRRFHALTERTRYTIGGIHAIDFMLSVTNATTGEVIIPPYLVQTRLKGYGGARALAAERAGQTQKVRITAYLAQVIRRELTGVPVEPAK